MAKVIPRKLFKQLNGHSDFLPMDKATICDFAPPMCIDPHGKILWGYRKSQGQYGDRYMEIVWIGNIYDPSFSTGYGGGVYGPNGIAPSVKARDYKDPTLVIEIWK